MKQRFFLVSCILTITVLLIFGSACAASIQLMNGPVSLTATPLNGTEEEKIPLDSFQIAGTYYDGSYLVYTGGKLYNVTPENMDKAVTLDFSQIDVPVIEDASALQRGSSGRQVTNLQISLRTLGYFSGAADGKLDAKTEAAIKAFQEAAGLEATGAADGITQLLVFAMAEDPIEMEGHVDPEAMYAPILGRTAVDLTPIMESGMTFTYDDISGEGFITDGNEIQADLSGESELEKAELTIVFGFKTQELEDGRVEVLPAMKVSCLCVRRPMMTEVTLKAGSNRGSAELGKLTVGLDGVYTVEEGTCLLTDEMVKVLAGAQDAGELKIRVSGSYGVYDVITDQELIMASSAIGKIASEFE